MDTYITFATGALAGFCAFPVIVFEILPWIREVIAQIRKHHEETHR